MTLPAGKKLGPYEILAPLGAGGMGEVYRAKDTRLEREVAVKILPEHLADLGRRKARFEREAKTISRLSHSHICTLYDLGEEDGISYLVMELLEGQSLAERLLRGALPLDETLRYGIEIAEALEAAHKHGITHRDLKPGNVMLTKGGVKLLDFGLAKYTTSGGSGGENASLAPTLAAASNSLTAQGTLMGTFQYMAPEQLEGEEADARSDIFALGCVLYEMATGRPAFSGKSQASLIGAILKEEPAAISSIQAMTPPAFDRLVQICLAKDPDERFQTAHDVKLQLQWIAEGGTRAGAPTVVSAHSERRETPSWAIAGVAILAAAIGLWLGFLLRAPKMPRMMHAAINLPPGLIVDRNNDSLALSPDGKTLAIAAGDATGRRQIYLRALDGPAPRALEGTKGATCPTWSPDGGSLAFFAGGKLDKINVASGAVQTLADAPQGRGIAWGSDGTIVYAPNISGPLWKVSVGGGNASALEKDVPARLSHRDPRFLPNGKSLLYLSIPTGSAQTADLGIYALDLASGRSQRLLPDISEGRYVPPGYLAFVRGGTLMVQRFDPRTVRVSGEALPVVQNVQSDLYRGTAEYAFAGSDFLVYQIASTGTLSQLTWYAPNGKELGTVGKPLEIRKSPFALRVSPDGHRAVATVGAIPETGLWMIDLATGVANPFTFGNQSALVPSWSPDGKSVLYVARQSELGASGVESIFLKDANGGSPAEAILTAGSALTVPTGWSPDGSVVAYQQESSDTKSWNIGILSMRGDHKLELLVQGPANEVRARFSPDGKWLAYLSDESGSNQLYVIPYPGPGGKWQITSNGTQGFAWASDHEIDNISEDGKLDAIELHTGAHETLAISSRHVAAASFPHSTACDYSRTLKRWLLAIPKGGGQESSITLVTSWTKLLAQH